jgi:hypothetical protein
MPALCMQKVLRFFNDGALHLDSHATNASPGVGAETGIQIREDAAARRNASRGALELFAASGPEGRPRTCHVAQPGFARLIGELLGGGSGSARRCLSSFDGGRGRRGCAKVRKSAGITRNVREAQPRCGAVEIDSGLSHPIGRGCQHVIGNDLRSWQRAVAVSRSRGGKGAQNGGFVNG